MGQIRPLTEFAGGEPEAHPSQTARVGIPSQSTEVGQRVLPRESWYRIAGQSPGRHDLTINSPPPGGREPPFRSPPVWSCAPAAYGHPSHVLEPVFPGRTPCQASAAASGVELNHPQERLQQYLPTTPPGAASSRPEPTEQNTSLPLCSRNPAAERTRVGLPTPQPATTASSRSRRRGSATPRSWRRRWPCKDIRATPESRSSIFFQPTSARGRERESEPGKSQVSGYPRLPPRERYFLRSHPPTRKARSSARGGF